MARGQYKYYKVKMKIKEYKPEQSKKIVIGLGVLMGIFILFVSPVLAFSISAPFMENDQLNLLPGDTRDLKFIMQNGGGATEDINVRVELLEGFAIAELTDPDDIFLVSPGDKIEVNLKITISEDTPIGYTQKVRLGFSTSSPSDSGSFTFGSNIEQRFDVVIVEQAPELEPVQQPEQDQEIESNLTVLWLIIGLVVVALIIVVIIMAKRRKTE